MLRLGFIPIQPKPSEETFRLCLPEPNALYLASGKCFLSSLPWADFLADEEKGKADEANSVVLNVAPDFKKFLLF